MSTMKVHSHHSLTSESPRSLLSCTIRIMILYVLAITVKTSKEVITFTFPTFSPGMPDIKLEGDASVSYPVIELTRNIEDVNDTGSIGRVTYSKPLHLWDKGSGELADFTTHFSCAINGLGNETKADGLAFFLVPFGSHIPPMAGGGNLGLYSLSSQVQFVAVELDTFPNSWDPKDNEEHIGIDLNSMTSVRTVNWSVNNVANGGRIGVWIYYNSSTKNLSVSVANGDRKSFPDIYLYNLSYVVDLRDYLPEWVTFGFTSATSKNVFERNQIYFWNFNSSLHLPETHEIPWFVWFIISVLVTVLFLGGFWYWRVRRAEDKFEEETAARRFTYEKLIAATNNFELEIGKGGFGNVYKGFLIDSSTSVAVKRIASNSQTQGFKEYASEVKTISRLRHVNLVQLIGWCRKRQGWCWSKQEVLLLVYEFMPNKSLDLHLFSERCQLIWEKRYSIALGLASALLYMQEECDPYVIHRDIKSDNVLLDSDFRAKLSDFGLARLVDRGQGPRTTMLLGTAGYAAPEYIASGKGSKRSDIYSFGVVALEIACGKPAITIQNPGDGTDREVKLVKWVWEHYGNDSILAAADPRLETYNEEELRRLLVVGLACANPIDSDRPCIRDAIDMLNFKASLPVLPAQMPVPTHIAAHMVNMFA